MGKVSSKACFALSMIWLITSLVLFTDSHTTDIALVWLVIALVELMIALLTRKKEKSARQKQEPL